MPNILISDNFYQGTSEACIVDLTPPVFSGINFLDVESRGQIRAGWAVATDPTAPIRYEIYIQPTTSVGLFNFANIVALTPNLQYDIYNLPDGSFLQNGVIYYVGIRAIDGVNNRDNNTVSMSVISTGILTSIDVYEAKASWSIDDSGDFSVTAWADKNGNTAKSPDAVLGTASYQVYDQAGAAVVGMSGSGVSPNAEGLYSFIAIPNLIDADHAHYEIKVVVSVDGENRENLIPIFSIDNVLTISGIADVNDSNQITGSFWVTENALIVTGASLGAGAYETYDTLGNLIPGLSETGITADANGFFVISPLPLGSADVTKAFIVKVSMIVNGESRSNFITLGNEPAVYNTKAVFSINASNQLEATFWGVKNDQQQSGAILGTASYTIYDKNGTAVAGLTQAGITADVNGLFHITPVSAVLLTDLTHYTAKVQISIAGSTRVSYKGFTLLGT